MPSEPDLFDGLYARGNAVAELTGRAWLQAMLDFEAALARAQAAAGRIPAAHVTRIAAACDGGDYDIAVLAREGSRHAGPVVGLVAELRLRAGIPAADSVHVGATSQDTIDTAAALVTRRALSPLLADAGAAARAAADLARAHVGTAMAGRTLLQQALPISFGLVAAGWASGIASASARLADAADRDLAVQAGGPVGSEGLAAAAAMAAELSLAEPAMPWHTVRVRPASLAAALGVLAGAVGKVARDVTLLASQEVGEVREAWTPGTGGSSTMAHKHNPVAAVSALACARRTPGLVATMLAAMEQEHQRAAGAWQAEWGTLTALLGLTASTACWGREMLQGLEVDPERMAANLAAMAATVPEAAHPERHLGAAETMVERALAEFGL
ncbi:MAG TPA: lyase family protein [Solirubrobacteraceae bacterium]|nr:lyase family protein [Solirubrobacteraceae bacterium]